MKRRTRTSEPEFLKLSRTGPGDRQRFKPANQTQSAPACIMTRTRMPVPNLNFKLKPEQTTF
jgi:hypothetical protein